MSDLRYLFESIEPLNDTRYIEKVRELLKQESKHFAEYFPEYTNYMERKFKEKR